MNGEITWKFGKALPVLVKGGAMGMVDGAPVYACGMTYPWRETEQAWYWDQGRGDWFPVEPCIPLGRAYTQGATLRDGLLVLGGRKRTEAGLASLDDAWWLRRGDGVFSWTRLPDMKYRRAIVSLGIAGGKILAFGGGEWEKSQGGAFTTRHLLNYEILDLDDLEAGWRDMGPLPFVPLVGTACASVDSALYVFGGYECWTAEGQRHIERYACAWHYAFANDAWTRLRDCPVTGSGWCAAPYGQTVLLLGGGCAFEHGGTAAAHQTLFTLEPGTPRQRIIGAYSDLVFAYDIAADTYRILPDRMPIGLNDLRCTVAGEVIYAAGGESVDLALSNTINSFMQGVVRA